MTLRVGSNNTEYSTNTNTNSIISENPSYTTVFPQGTINSSKEAAAPETQTSANSYNDKKSEDVIESVLDRIGINFKNESVDFQKDVLRKYNNMIAIAKNSGQTLSDDVIESRITNYAKGWKFHHFEANNILGTNKAEYESDCSKAKTYKELRESYQQFGKEYVEFGDMDDNSKLGVHEMYFQELTEYYQTKGMNKQDATKKAIETTKKFQKFNINNLPDENNPLYLTDEMDLFVKVLGKVTTLDADGDQELSADESGAYLMSMAQFDDSKNNITAQENIRTELAIGTNGMSVEEIMEEYDLDKKTAENIISYQKKFNNKLEAYQEFIINGKMPGRD